MEVIITGTGVVSPVGVGTEAFMEGVGSSKTGVGEITTFEAKGKRGGVVTDFDFMGLFGDKKFRRAARVTQFALVAAKEALRSAALDLTDSGTGRIAIVVGVSHGAICLSVDFHRGLVEDGPLGASPAAFSDSVLNAPAGNLSLAFKIKGPAHTIVGGSPSGLEALNMGRRLIADGLADICLVVSTEELNERVYEAYDRLGYVSPDVSGEGTPFSSAGFLPGEGAACLVLEGKVSALKRVAEPLASLAATSSVYSSGGAEGLMKSMDRVLGAAGVSSGDVDCVMSGASGTQASLDEGVALGMTLKESTPVRGIKGIVGESFGAASLMGAVAAVSVVKEGRRLWTKTSGTKTSGSDQTSEAAPEWGWADLSSKADNTDTVLVTATGLLGESAAAVIRKVE